MSKPKKLRSRKAGLPPGSLIHIGEIKTSEPSFSIIDFDERGLQETQLPNAAALGKIVEQRGWLGHLATDPATRSTTSVCLTVEGADEALIKTMAGALEKEGAAYDVAGYRDAPAGLRIWCGATVDTADIEALGPWLDWAYATAKAA